MGVSYLLRRAAQIRPEGTAIVFGARRQSWREFHDRVRRLAGGLKSAGLEPDDRVAMVMANSDRYVEILIAAPWVGGAVVGLNARWSLAELADSLDDSAARFLMVDDQHLEAGLALAAERTGRVTLIYAGGGAVPPGAIPYSALLDSEPAEDCGRTGSDLFTILYTGGTTGRSKGVMLSHNNMVSCSLYGMAEGLFGGDSIYLNAMPMFHTGGVWPFVSMMASAGTSVVLPGFTADAALEAIAEERVTEALLVPTMVQRLIEHPDFPNRDTSSFRQVLYGASPITESLLERAVEAMPQARFVQCYGMTELSPLACVLPDRHLRGEERVRGRHRAAGRSCPGVEVRIVDPDDQPVPSGTVGEIAVRGPNVMLGYWNRPEETAAALKGGWMHTGDGGWMDEEGFVYVADRVKDMIISGGENIFSVEVENAIAQHPAVQQCAVIGIPSREWIETVHAIIVPHPGMALAVEEIILHCRARIAHYKCPRSVEIRTEPLPLSAAGKVLKRELRAEYLRASN